MENEQTSTDLVDQFFDFLSQLVMPDWAALITLIPIVFVVLIVVFLVYVALMWRRAGSRNRSRVPRRLPAGAPPPGVHLPGPSRWPFVLPIGAAMIVFALVLPPRNETGDPTAPFNVPLLVLGLVVFLVAVVGWLREAMREWRSTAVASDGMAVALAPGGHAVPETAGGAGGPAAVAVRPRRVPPAEPPPGVHMPGPSPWPFFAPLGIALLIFGLIISPVLAIGGLVLSVIAAAGWIGEANHEYRSTEQVGHAVPRTRDPERAWPRRLVPWFVGIAALSLVVTLAPVWLEPLRGLVPGQPGESVDAVPERPEVTARSAASFETKLLVVPAARDFELVFNNEHEGVPHDVAITEGPERATEYFNGADITGVASATYQVPALEEGEYYFLCTIHPNMNGTVEARAEP